MNHSKKQIPFSCLGPSKKNPSSITRSDSSGSAIYSISLPASTRLRRRSKGKPCMVCKTGRAPTPIVVFAIATSLGVTAGKSSLFFASPHLTQKGTQRPCTRAWERRCRHVGSLFIASVGPATAVSVYTFWLTATAGKLSIFLASSSSKQKGIQRP